MDDPSLGQSRFERRQEENSRFFSGLRITVVLFIFLMMVGTALALLMIDHPPQPFRLF